METAELRIGNLVNLCFEHKEGWYKAKVTEILNDNTINTDTKESDNNHYYFEPIPLSEEILLKLGMTNNNYFRPERLDFQGVDNGQFHIDQLNGRFVFRGLGMTIVYVDFLHDLQNLYFACKRTELNTSGLI